MKHLIWCILIGFMMLSGCRQEHSAKEETLSAKAGQTSFEPCKIVHAQGFNIEYFKGYKLVTIHTSGTTPGQDLRYVLLEKGTKIPDALADAQVIHIPIKSMAATSSMHIGPLEFLESEQVLTGLSDLRYVYSPKIRSLIESGKIAKIGRDTGLNEEKLVEMSPDVIMTVGNPGAKVERHAVLREAGIPVLVNSEWVEKTPLARAEWVKLIAALLNKEKLVNEKFRKIETEYDNLRRMAGKAKIKPSIISGLNTKDAWFMPSGDGFMALFFKDAGARYHWANSKAEGSLPLHFEAVYPIALQADFWINVGFDPKDTRESILAQDRRYADFKAFQNKQLYSYNNRVSDQGANDFFESGTVNPHVVLADLITIFHPELMPGRPLVYYKKLK